MNTKSQKNSAIHLYQHSPLPVLLLNEKAEIIWTNPAAQHIIPVILQHSGLSGILPYNFTAKLKALEEQDTISQSIPELGLELSFFSLDAGTVFLVHLRSIDSKPVLMEKAVSISQASINEVLTNIFSSLIILKNRSELYEDTDGYQQLQHINKECFRLLKRAGNLREYLRLAAADKPQQLKSIDITEHLRQLASALQAKLRGAEQITLLCELPAQSIFVQADTALLDTALFNLIDNSIQYRFSQEPLQIQLSLRQMGDTVSIRVQDNGPGLSAESAAQAFEPFFSSSDEPHGNLGLGLTVAKLITESFGGQIMASFQEGSGTGISLLLPVDKHTAILRSPALQDNSSNYYSRYSPLHIFLADSVAPPMP